MVYRMDLKMPTYIAYLSSNKLYILLNDMAIEIEKFVYKDLRNTAGDSAVLSGAGTVCHMGGHSGLPM